MPNLSWNEIRQRAIHFSRKWSTATREQADKQTFWNDFFDGFGLSRRTVASLEIPVQRQSGSHGFIDLLWKGRVLAEHKTARASLEGAETFAFRSDAANVNNQSSNSYGGYPHQVGSQPADVSNPRKKYAARNDRP